jgi:hypothetical protein
MNEFRAYILLLFLIRFPFQKRREEKQLQDKEHDKEFYQNKNPKSASKRHTPETVPIKLPNMNNMFNHSLFL